MPPFVDRHLGPRSEEIQEMLALLGVSSLSDLANRVVPQQIRLGRELELPAPLSEEEALAELRRLAQDNLSRRSYIGMGYYGTFLPKVLQRNILENPGWYTQYTPYQAEIAQGRLEALLNFQTVVCDLTALEVANASLLDEGTAAAEAMTMCRRLKDTDRKTRFLVSPVCHPQTIAVLATRAAPLGIELVIGDELDDTFFGALIQYPDTEGAVRDPHSLMTRARASDALVVAATDLLALTILPPPGEWGADIAVGSSQRFGIPLGYGGPHAAFFATREAFRRQLPGRLVGVSTTADGQRALRLALQTREQHIRRDRATSNICTAQVLLAVLAGMYAVYHGPDGLKAIAARIHELARSLAAALRAHGLNVKHAKFFDSLLVGACDVTAVRQRAQAKGLALRYFGDAQIGASLDETTTAEDLLDLIEVLTGSRLAVLPAPIPSELPTRASSYLEHEVFARYRSETEMLRYIKRLESRDLSLCTSMIPLGSCTMKLNAAAEMYPISWPEFSQLHPFAPSRFARGYEALFSDLERWLAEISGLPAVSLQPNAGSQGEYAGLLAIRGYHRACGEGRRSICLIPTSAHGTNPASAVLAGCTVVPVRCDTGGNVDLTDLREKATAHAANLAALMVTYPSTHGVFEESIAEICSVVHAAGGQVYMDGANMNALVGLCRPGDFGIDVCHFNLHKTFCIPHGGGGPGVGPIAVATHLAPFLPHHPLAAQSGAVASAPHGSAGILPIPWMYLRLMGAAGLKTATLVAILNANYIARRLEREIPVLYRGAGGFVAHECVLDFRALKRASGVEVEDVAKRLMDYGFHAPTISFPVADTVMVEPTESESKAELDRFCAALLAIRAEIQEIIDGRADRKMNVLKNAPHTAQMVTRSEWPYPYSREKAAYPAAWLREHKFWPPVARIDNAYGDRHLFCTCAAV